MENKLNVTGYSGNRVTANNSYTGKIVIHIIMNCIYSYTNIRIGTHK